MSVLDLLRNEPDRQQFAAGTTIFQAGDHGDFLYAVVDGVVSLHIHGREVERVGSGGVFGEMALIEGLPRSATAIAETDCVLAQVPESRFLWLVQQVPNFALYMMRVISHRLRRKGD